MTKTSIEIEKFDIVRELCASRQVSVKRYVNSLIRADMMRQNEYFSNKYFKGIEPK